MLQKVKIESDALQVCMAHALSNEKEEVMGLLVGEVEEGISHIFAIIMLYRLDKRKDRVEISSEQLSAASSKAEIFVVIYEIGLKTRVRRPLRIVGWYHSHPHITVWPSHVDIRTQAMYQLMDTDFVGIILSCFNDDSNDVGQMQVTCFQSAKVTSSNPPSYERREVEQEIVNANVLSEACLESLATFPELLLREERDAYGKSLGAEDQDLVTAISNASAFAQTLMKVIELVCAPYMQNMDRELLANQQTLSELGKRLDVLRGDQNDERTSMEVG